MLEARGVALVYPSAAGEIRALADIFLDVARGEFVSILGPSGCGKSTLLSILGGLLPPSAGEVRFEGGALDGPSSRIGFVFQDPVLLPWRSVLDNVLLPAQLGRVGGSVEARARELLAMLGLAGFEANHPRELSGGMRQRVAIARALLLDPEVLLIDAAWPRFQTIVTNWRGSREMALAGRLLALAVDCLDRIDFAPAAIRAARRRAGRSLRTAGWILDLAARLLASSGADLARNDPRWTEYREVLERLETER